MTTCRFRWMQLTAISIAIPLIFFGGCKAYQIGKYQLGHANMYRQDIATVHVAMVESGSFRPFLGQRVTESVAKAVEDRTPFRLADAAVADSFLRVNIINDSKRAAGLDRFDDVRNVAIGLVVEATWTDRRGVPLMERQLLRLDNGVNFIPEGGQSMTTAQQELIDRIGRQVVGHMEFPW
ncbi:MAG TPA: LPS assembly lipoprotein LptE [Pirellulaceae bacterium]|nr:LPS assembly lipoprotein LptE [Pirellulaceae bacterium]